MRWHAPSQIFKKRKKFGAIEIREKNEHFFRLTYSALFSKRLMIQSAMLFKKNLFRTLNRSLKDSRRRLDETRLELRVVEYANIDPLALLFAKSMDKNSPYFMQLRTRSIQKRRSDCIACGSVQVWKTASIEQFSYRSMELWKKVKKSSQMV